MVSRERPPAHVVAAAQREQHLFRAELATLVQISGELVADKHTEVEAITDLWMTLLCNSPRKVAIVAPTAIMQLAQSDPSGR